MLEIISHFLLAIVTYFMNCYMYCKINKKKFQITPKLIIFVVFVAMINTYSRQHYNSTIDLVISNLELVFLLKYIYNESIIKVIVSILIILILYTLGELVYALITIYILQIEKLALTETISGHCITNLSILAIVLLLSKNKKIMAISNKIINWQKDNKYINTTLLVVLAFITLAALLYPISTNSNSPSSTFLFVLFILCTIIFVTGFFNEKSENNKLNENYDTLIDYLKVYEKEINEKSKLQHEFKNQLILIKEMDTSKKVKNYISNLLGEDEETQNKLLLSSLKDVPNGGLKGLIYYKLNHLSEDVELHIHVGSDIDQKVWDKINLNDASKIVGILLDNAIDAINKEEKKYLVLDLDECDDNLIFTVSNSCTKKIDFDNLDKEGYSTKGKNHGYGLPLLNDIIRKNKNVKIKRELNGIMFSTKIYMKI